MNQTVLALPALETANETARGFQIAAAGILMRHRLGYSDQPGDESYFFLSGRSSEEMKAAQEKLKGCAPGKEVRVLKAHRPDDSDKQFLQLQEHLVGKGAVTVWIILPEAGLESNAKFIEKNASLAHLRGMKPQMVAAEEILLAYDNGTWKKLVEEQRAVA